MKLPVACDGSDCSDAALDGARGVGLIHRLLPGSVSSSVAADAHCSVEVIRRLANAFWA